jgi:hypothetical protein
VEGLQVGWGEGCIEDVLQLQLSILSQVGVYFLGRGTNRRLWAAQQPEASFVGEDVFRQVLLQHST